MNSKDDLSTALNQVTLKDNPSSSFTFNPNASEFVPTISSTANDSFSTRPQPDHFPLQSNNTIHHYGYKSETNTQEHFEPSRVEESGMYLPPTFPEHLTNAMMYGPHGHFLMEIQVGLEQLLDKPDEFEIWSEAIQDRLLQRNVDHPMMELAINLILEMGILHPANSYLIARLCAVLCPSVADFLTSYLIPQCRLLHEARHNLQYVDPERYRCFVQMLAELYLRLESTASGSRWTILGEALYETLDTLLEYPQNEDNLKCAARLLKCAGSALETDFKDKMPPIIDKIKEIIKVGSLAGNTKSIMQSIIDLRNKEWGINATGVSSNATSNSIGAPTYLGADDEALSAEERAFLEEHCGGILGRESEDEEINAAYEEFVAGQQNRGR